MDWVVSFSSRGVTRHDKDSTFEEVSGVSVVCCAVLCMNRCKRKRADEQNREAGGRSRRRRRHSPQQTRALTRVGRRRRSYQWSGAL